MEDSNKLNVPDKVYLDKIKSNYTYDRSTGHISSNYRPSKTRSPNNLGYLNINIRSDKDIRCYKVHHVVWFFEYGSWPNTQIDHINGDKADNHYTNLRSCTQRENVQFYLINKGGKASAFLGVTQNGRNWRAKIAFKGKVIELGTFICELDAADAYDNKLIDLGLEPVNCRSSIYSKMKRDKETK